METFTDSKVVEPILKENNDRFSLFPINYPDVWEAYKTAEAAQWTANEIDFGADKKDWGTLNKDEKFFIEHILAFFAGSDGIVLENLLSTFSTEIQIPEARAFLALQGYIETVHCVSANTKIMTDTGYYEIGELKNKQVNVWNGSEFSNVEIKYTGDQLLYKVQLDNGMELDCTDEHKWFVEEDSIEDSKMIKKFTKDLKIGDVVYKYDFPVLDKDCAEFKNPYVHGLFCGDGTICNFEVPMNYSINTKLRWLEGFVDSSNTLVSDVIQIVSTNKKFLKDLQLMISTLGVHTNIDENTLYITNTESLIKLGFMPKVLKINSVKSDVKVIKIKSVTELDIQPTYCFSEPLKHAGIFNGILTGQSEVYGKMIDTLIEDLGRKRELFRAIDTIPCVSKKAQWALKWMDPKSKPFNQRIIGFIIVEGLFFSGSFCSIFWLKNKGKMASALGKSNEMISRDEGMHTDFNIMIYHKLIEKCDQETVHSIFKEAIEIEVEFICESLPCRLIGMNSDLMTQYIHYTADQLLNDLGCEPLYNVENPFDFMDNINLNGKSNFFEQRVTEYQRAYSVSDSSKRVFNLEGDDDF